MILPRLRRYAPTTTNAAEAGAIPASSIFTKKRVNAMRRRLRAGASAIGTAAHLGSRPADAMRRQMTPVDRSSRHRVRLGSCRSTSIHDGAARRQRGDRRVAARDIPRAGMQCGACRRSGACARPCAARRLAGAPDARDVRRPQRLGALCAGDDILHDGSLRFAGFRQARWRPDARSAGDAATAAG